MRIYLKTLLVLAALTLLMAAPDAASFALGAIFGFPVLFSATALLYGLCLAPLVACWSLGVWTRVIGAAVTAGLVAFVALTPDYIGRRDADAAAIARLASDHAPKDPVGASTLEIRRPTNDYDGTLAEQSACGIECRALFAYGQTNGRFADPRACGIECRALLASGQAKWVRVVEFDNAGAKAAPVSSLHRALHGKDCAVPGGEKNDSAVCVVEAADPGDAADLVVDFTSSVAAKPAHLSRFASLIAERAVVARARQADQVSEVLRETTVLALTPVQPTVLVPTTFGHHSGGTDIWFDIYTINPVPLLGALTRLGYVFAPKTVAASTISPRHPDWLAPSDDRITREMIAVLDLPGSAPFNHEQMATLADWIEHDQNVAAWTPDQLALLRRFVRDRRVSGPTYFGMIFVRRPEVAKTLLPDVLDMIEADGLRAEGSPAEEAFRSLAKIDEALLRPYAGRIIGLLDKSQDVRAILFPLIGRVGVDPLPYLTPILADRTTTSRFYVDLRTIGACLADPQWAPELVPAVRRAYFESKAIYGDGDGYREFLLKILLNLGDRDFVEHELGSDTSLNTKWLRRDIAYALAQKHPADRLCQR